MVIYLQSAYKALIKYLQSARKISEINIVLCGIYRGPSITQPLRPTFKIKFGFKVKTLLSTGEHYTAIYHNQSYVLCCSLTL